MLHDARRRVAVLNGRPGMPRSIGSVYAAWTVLFLGADFRAARTRTLNLDPAAGDNECIALTRDGSALLVTNQISDTVSMFRVADGRLLRTIGGLGTGPAQFNRPWGLFVAADGHVFVADKGNARVQELTPALEYCGVFGARQRLRPRGVCADADVVAFTEPIKDCVTVFARRDGAFRSRFMCGSLPVGLCLVNRCIAVLLAGQASIAVFTLDGALVRHMGRGVLQRPSGIFCSPYGELVVADVVAGVWVFDAHGTVCRRMVCNRPRSVALHQSTIFAQCAYGTCEVFA